MITACKREGSIKWVKMQSFVSFSHLLFVDDVILLGLGTQRKAGKCKEILDLYIKATGMEVNVCYKSSILFTGLGEEWETQSKQIFPYTSVPVNKEVKYLGLI